MVQVWTYDEITEVQSVEQLRVCVCAHMHVHIHTCMCGPDISIEFMLISF